jgi:hypothetical protein
MSLKAIDRLCLRGIVGREPVTFEISDVEYTGTCGAREMMQELTDGGVFNGQEFAILVPTENIADMDSKPSQRQVIAVCVDSDGIPCVADEAVATRAQCRITRIVPSLAGITYTLQTAQRG